MSLRKYRVQQFDTLRTIAFREYGDASRWVELAKINKLQAPHIVESKDPTDRLSNTVIWGDYILLPTQSLNFTVYPEVELFGIDFDLPQGNLSIVDGDIGTISGVPNFRQALKHRIKTLKNELDYHPRYGCNVQLALALKLEPVINLMAAAWVSESLREETRLASVDLVTAKALGDSITVEAQVTATGVNSPIDFNLVVT